MILLMSLAACGGTKASDAADSQAGVQNAAGTEIPGSGSNEPVPGFSVDAVRPLLYAAGSVIGWGYAAEFDAPRALDADRRFADALLYEFLNPELYDQSIQIRYDDESFMRVMKAEDMLFLLRQYIGDYPELIQPPAGLFIYINNEGDYIYGGSDKGTTDYETEVENVTYAGGGAFEVTVMLYMLDFDEDAEAPKKPLNTYKLRFIKADNSAYGYTIVKCGETK